MDIRPRITHTVAKPAKPQAAKKTGATSKNVSPAELHSLKEQICDIGRRIYNKGFAAGNDGNISYRLGENEVLCTPTMIWSGVNGM